MRKYPMGEAIAEQVFEIVRLDGSAASVVIRVGKPLPDPDAPDRGWMCPYQIAGFGPDRAKATFGLDSVHALTLALHMFPIELVALAEAEGATLRYLGQAPVYFGGLCRTLLNATGGA